MVRRAYIAGNWKMHKTLSEARTLAEDIIERLPSATAEGPRVGLFPSTTCVAHVVATVKESNQDLVVGAQNMHWEESGAFTGETSAAMISSTGATAVILGHSERRHVFNESDEAVGKKVAKALESNLEPILCVGETLAERENGTTNDVVARQLKAGIAEVPTAAALAHLVIAYEPVWAIGTGKTATPQQGQEVQSFLRSELRAAFRERGSNGEEADAAPILYGGSVKPGNAAEILAEEDIDGLLVGGASLEAESFVAICDAAAR